MRVNVFLIAEITGKSKPPQQSWKIIIIYDRKLINFSFS